MRELTKSMLRASLAMPLFGIKQMTSLAVPTRENLESTTRAFDAVTEAAERQLGSAFQGLYEAGEEFQRGLVDAGFGMLLLDRLNPAHWLAAGSSALTPSAAVPPAGGVPRWVNAPQPPASTPQSPTPRPQATAGPSASSLEAGWGPMPD